MSRDYYPEALDLAARLDSAGRAQDAEAIREAIRAGSTATEILMALRWNLQRLEREEPAIGADGRERMHALRNAIDEALKVTPCGRVEHAGGT